MYSASAVFKDSFSGCNSLNISIYDPSGVIPVTIAGDVSYGSGRYTSIPMKTLYIPANIREIEMTSIYFNVPNWK